MFRTAFVSRTTYPDASANALQSILMADALARASGDGHLFVHDVIESPDSLKERYGLTTSPLVISSMRTHSWPRLVTERGWARCVTYNTLVASTLGSHPRWRRGGRRNVLFVRSRLETLYWGLLRARTPLWRHWVFVCELHDLNKTPVDAEPDDSPHVARLTRALGGYDLVLAVSRGLASDVRRLTKNAIDPVLVPMTSGLTRLATPPSAGAAADTVTVGYIGRIDPSHGVDELVDSLRQLPARYRLRLTGNLDTRHEGWIRQQIDAAGLGSRVEVRPPVRYTDVAAEIDACDLVVATGGPTTHSRRYRSPLKLFDYMARGKPIVAAGVPCHRELLEDGRNALLYPPGDSAGLARCLDHLGRHPDAAQQLGRRAWEQAARTSYETRAQQILHLARGSRRVPADHTASSADQAHG